MREVTIAGQTYRVDRLDALKQFHIARRLAPVLTEAGPVLLAALKASRGGGLPSDEEALLLFEPMAKAIAALSDQDSETVIQLCMGAVKRKVDTSWAAVMSGKQMMYSDIELPHLMQLVIAVIQENLANFMPASGSTSATGPAA